MTSLNKWIISVKSEGRTWNNNNKKSRTWKCNPGTRALPDSHLQKMLREAGAYIVVVPERHSVYSFFFKLLRSFWILSLYSSMDGDSLVPSPPPFPGLICRLNNGANCSTSQGINEKCPLEHWPELTKVDSHLLCYLWGWHFSIDSSLPDMTFLLFHSYAVWILFLSLLMIMSCGTESRALLKSKYKLSLASSPWSTGLITSSGKIRLFWQDWVCHALLVIT